MRLDETPGYHKTAKADQRVPPRLVSILKAADQLRQFIGLRGARASWCIRRDYALCIQCCAQSMQCCATCLGQSCLKFAHRFAAESGLLSKRGLR